MRLMMFFSTKSTVMAMIPRGLVQNFCSAAAIAIHSETSFRGARGQFKEVMEMTETAQFEEIIVSYFD